MIIAIVADPDLPVPPRLYGGIERVIDFLVRELGSRGHEVTLFAHPESRVPCRLVPLPGPSASSYWDSLRNTWVLSSHLRAGKFDLVHCFARLAYLAPILPLPIPKIKSYQRAITGRSINLGRLLSRPGTLHFTGLSRRHIADFSTWSNWHIVYNGVPQETYRPRYSVSPEAALIYLGRIEPIKGVHLAIDVALQSGRRLVIAGNIPDEPKHHRYFESEIRPRLDGDRVRYVGSVTDEQKNELLGRSAALLLPLQIEEPFGIVMAEALATGTPVIALDRGSVPDIVEQGVNGFVCASLEQMVEAVGRLPTIDRRECRRIMEERFSDRAVTDQYERLYQMVVAQPSRQ